MSKKISINIMSNKSIQNAVKEVESYAYELTDKCNELAKKLAQVGVQTAKMKVAQYDAVYTGELLSSINYVNNHGEKGWFYFRDGEWHWTKGMPSRPFMYETSIELAEKIVEVAKEVFG